MCELEVHENCTEFKDMWSICGNNKKKDLVSGKRKREENPQVVYWTSHIYVYGHLSYMAYERWPIDLNKLCFIDYVCEFCLFCVQQIVKVYD